MSRPPPLLRRSLLANATFSGVTGLLLIAFAGPIASVMGLTVAWPVLVVGVGLVPFAALVALNGVRPVPDAREAGITVALDAAWVAGSVLLLAWSPSWLTLAGASAVLTVAAIVAGFALAQAAGLRRLAAASARGAAAPP